MGTSLTLGRVWRLLKEVDLEAVRREAARRVHLLVIGETTADADDLAVRLAEGQDDPTAWLTAIDAGLGQLGPARSAAGGREAVVDGPDIVVFVTRGADTSPEMTEARQQWLHRPVGLVTVALASGAPSGLVHARDRSSRVAIDHLDEAGLGSVVDALFDVIEPDKRLAWARQFPALRPKVYHALIDDTARANAAYAFSTGLAEVVPLLDIPLNIGDMVVLTKNQLMMAYRLALAAGKDGRPRDLLGEIVGVLGGGLLFRQIARQLVGLVPVIGLVPKVAVAYGGTWAIGRAIVLWVTDGHKVAGRRLKELTREGMTRGRAVARSLAKRQAPPAP
jgi:uncharacterized protein (DUF697 family)